MIVRKIWRKYKKFHRYKYIGWFLFGLIPLYIRREEY